jgi:hypothetical protein
MSRFVLWGVFNGTNPNPRTTYLAIVQNACKFKDFTHSNSILHCGFVKLNWLYLLKHFKRFGPNLNLLMKIKIIHHKLGWIYAYSPIFIYIAICDWFPWKEATCNRHDYHGSTCNLWTIANHITPCVVCPHFLVGHLLLKVLHYIKLLLNHLTWFFKNPPWD